MTIQDVEIGDSGTITVNKLKNNFTELGQASDVDDMPSAAALDGTEKVPALQGAGAVSLTTEQLAGDAVSQKFGVARTHRRFFTDFRGLPPNPAGGAILTANGYLGDSVNFVQSAEGNCSKDLISWGVSTGIKLDTHDATPSGVPGMAGVVLGFAANLATYVDLRFAVCASVPWLNASGNVDHFLGVFPSPTDAYPSSGVYFKATTEIGDVGSDSNFWRTVVDDGVGTPEEFKSSVAVVSPAIFNSPMTVLRIVRDNVLEETRFYIDGTLVGSPIPFTTMGWPTSGSFVYGAFSRKETVASTAGMILSAISLVDNALPSFRNGDMSLL